MIEALYILLGTSLTFLATLIIEIIKNFLGRKSKENNTKLFLSLEFSSIDELLQKLKVLFSQNGKFDMFIIINLKEQTEQIYNLKGWSLNYY